ncbi:MAG: DUF2953 domain-containing protein [Lachnospiraceae bacterium]
MLHIIGLIFKIIMIILLIILGVLVLLLGIILLVPIRYRIRGTGDGPAESVDIKLTVSWLFHLIGGFVSYSQNKFNWQIRIVWKKLNVSTKESTPKESTSKESTLKESASKESTQKELIPEKEEPIIISKNKEIGKKDTKEVEKLKESSKSPTTEKLKISKKNIWTKSIEFFQKIKYTFHKIYANIIVILEKKERILTFTEDEIHRAALQRTLVELKRFMKFLKPKKLKAKIHFGFEDPYNTGQVLAIVSVLYPFFGSHIIVDPDFEHQVFDGNFYIKGHIRVVYIIIIAWNLFWDKNVRTTYKHIKAFEL